MIIIDELLPKILKRFICILLFLSMDDSCHERIMWDSLFIFKDSTAGQFYLHQLVSKKGRINQEENK
jgi:hypothetical protein